MADDATRADKAGSQQWVPGRAAVSETVSAGSTLGKPAWSERLRRRQPGDADLGEMTETVLDGWKIKESRPKCWVADTDEESK